MSSLLVWTGFLLALLVLLWVCRRNFALGMFLGAFVLAILTIPPIEIGLLFASALVDPSTLLLAFAVGLIPIVGGLLKETGQMDILVRNLRIGKKAILTVSPALLGMLPMPGGALLSAPMVEKAGEAVSKENKCGLNVWFRHVIFLIYPLTPALIVSSRIAGLDYYGVLLYLTPFFLLALFLGYFFFLRNVKGEIEYGRRSSLKRLFPPLAVIFIAPALDFLIKALFEPSVSELATLVAVASSLALVVGISRLKPWEFGEIVWKSKPWNFALIIVGMTVFLNVFTASGVPDLIQTLQISPLLLCGVIAFLLGFATGRIQTPALIIIPIFLTKGWLMTAPIFAVMYFSIFLGYALSPIHPCVSLSLQFFDVGIRDFLKVISPPTLLGLMISLILLLFIG